MRKNIIVLTAGIVASLMIVTGCSSQSTAETTTPAATEIQTEVQTTAEETTIAEAESAEEGTESDSMAEIGVDVPIKIFGTITEVADGTIVVDNQAETSSLGEMVLMIDPESTLILDAQTGFPTELESVQGGSFEAYIGPAMTMSLPPQTTPMVVVVNLAEDAAAPQYVVSACAVEEIEGNMVLTANDGSEYQILAEAEVEPFLTRNIVTMEDVHEGSRCLVWLNADGQVEKLALFAE